MAQNTTIRCAAGVWTLLTDSDVTGLTFQNHGPSPIEIAVTTAAVAPSDFDGSVRYQKGQGEVGVALSDLAPGIAGARVYAFAGDVADVAVSHG